MELRWIKRKTEELDGFAYKVETVLQYREKSIVNLDAEDSYLAIWVDVPTVYEE